MTNPLLHITNLSIGYNADSVLIANINLELHAGSFTGLLGANGSGKSTLVKTISNTISALAGKVELSNTPISEFSKKDLAKKLAYIPSSTSYTPGISVYDLLSFARIPYQGWTQKLSKVDIQLIESCANKVGVESLLQMRFHELSEGQKQLVNIAKALVQETQIIILDEPTAHLDVVNKIKVFELLKSLALEGKTILCISHDIHNIKPFLDQIAVISKDSTFQIFPSQEKETNSLLELLF